MAYSSNSTPIPQTQFNSEIIYYTKSGVVSIYKGSAVFLRSGNATNGLQVGDIFVGICKDTVKLTERETVGVDSKGIFAFNCNDESVTVGSVAYIDNGVNNATITTTAPLTGLKVAIGNVVAVENGFVFVRVDNAIGNVVADVTPSVPVTGVSLSAYTTTVEEGSTVTITETVAPDTATNDDVRWETFNPGIATVSEGVITGVDAGTTTIGVTTIDGHFKAYCVVTVTEPEEDTTE